MGGATRYLLPLPHSDSAKGRSTGVRKPNEQLLIKLISEGQVGVGVGVGMCSIKVK